ncbi:uroporphyrinogen-III synthase [Marinomonas ostreistagni]|uniref:Uroporphyrinogen-III synthase n=1 Tax=Marinomonas ostreistagni TaxID=359209 RepID=A0ABS0Z6Q0_9GAMM|nr:uroporphyrinogen-III synthase [Marinomonas ostreistagni]MBJ7549329.1 uroporphyrinogen-III synthase [Marinomonas ostreistagni]
MQGVKVLVTRPEPENALTCQALTALGATPISLPMLEIRPLSSNAELSALRSQLYNLDLYQFVIFVSKNAARLAAELIDECWPMLPVGMHWLGIGQGTTETLKDLNIPALSNPGNNTEAMLDWLKPAKMRDQRVLIVRGVGGRPDLAKGLEERGAIVDHLELYKRLTPEYTAQTFLFLEHPDVIWATSGESLANLTTYVDQFAPNFKSTALFVPSERVAQRAKSLHWNTVICAHGADDQCLIAATKQHLGRKHDR